MRWKCLVCQDQQRDWTVQYAEILNPLLQSKGKGVGEGDGGLGEGGHFHDRVKQQNFDDDRYSIWSTRVFDGEIYSVGGLNLKIISVQG